MNWAIMCKLPLECLLAKLALEKHRTMGTFGGNSTVRLTRFSEMQTIMPAETRPGRAIGSTDASSHSNDENIETYGRRCCNPLVRLCSAASGQFAGWRNDSGRLGLARSPESLWPCWLRGLRCETEWVVAGN